MVDTREQTRSVREKMKEFWEKNCTHANLQDVMLDSMADRLDSAEKAEIMSLLPSLANKRILELGAGIGRYTAVLAEQASSVKAVDFIEKFLLENRTLNSATHPNVEFVCSDVMSLDLGENEFDLIFSNWLLMYLDDSELDTLAARLLRALKPGGHIFFRETCCQNSADRVHLLDDGGNPTQYRDPQHYHRVYETTTCRDTKTESMSGLELRFSRCIHAYLKSKANPNEMCWLWKKVALCKATQGAFSMEASQSMREYLDEVYFMDRILALERFYGENFFSPGGIKTVKNALPKLELKEGDKVLDAGSGLGGACFFMAENYGVDVLGVDLSTNMVQIALKRAVQCKRGTVMFEVADLTKRQFADSTFDAIYSCGVTLHIEDKQELLKDFFRWLKPNGRIVITDYCTSSEQPTGAVKDLLQRCNYFMHTPDGYSKLLKKAGFDSVVGENHNAQFLNYTQQEVKKWKENRQAMIEGVSEKVIDEFVTNRVNRMEYITKGDLSWILFAARKLKTA